MGFTEDEHQPLLLPITLSVAIHLLVLLIFITLPARMPESPQPTIVEVIPLSPEDREIVSAVPRIADIDEPLVQKKPEKARFVGLYNSSTEKETVAKKPGKGGGSGSDGKKVSSGSEAKNKKGTGVKKGDAVSKEKMFNFNENLFAMREPTSTSRTPDPSGGTVSIGGGGGGDFFPDITIGEYTYLNVLRYPEVSYFVRLKRVFRTTFNPIPSLRNYFSMNQVARGSVEVVMGMSVDKAGSLSELFVLRTSGIPDYDREAMRTVRASAPFSTPPAKFLAKDGVLRMMWTFTVYL